MWKMLGGGRKEAGGGLGQLDMAWSGLPFAGLLLLCQGKNQTLWTAGCGVLLCLNCDIKYLESFGHI